MSSIFGPLLYYLGNISPFLTFFGNFEKRGKYDLNNTKVEFGMLVITRASLGHSLVPRFHP